MNDNLKKSDILVIGGGPSGMMAAYQAKLTFPEKRVIIVERNSEVGTKLMLSGNGRCNVSVRVSNEALIQAANGHGKFLYSTLQQFNPETLIHFFESHGCPLKEEDHHRLFPQSDRAADIRKVLLDCLDEAGVLLETGVCIEHLDAEQRIAYSSKTAYHFNHLIVATGGRSFPQTGSDGLGYQLLASVGLTVTELWPVESPLVSQHPLIQSKVLQGIALKDVELRVLGQKKTVLKHDLLFTHFGLSGPVALQASFSVQQALRIQKSVPIQLDFLPEVAEEELQYYLIHHTLDQLAKMYRLPKRLLAVLSAEPGNWGDRLKRFRMEVSDVRGFNTAFVTAGGVALNQIDPKTMKAKQFPWLSVCGEALDLNSWTGGYNLTMAFSSGYSAGVHCLAE